MGYKSNPKLVAEIMNKYLINSGNLNLPVTISSTSKLYVTNYKKELPTQNVVNLYNAVKISQLL